MFGPTKNPIVVEAKALYGSVQLMCACTAIGMMLDSGIIRNGTFFCCPKCGQIYKLVFEDWVDE